MALNALILALITGVSWPAYIVIKAGPLPGITMDRIFTLVIMVFFITHIVTKPQALERLKAYGKPTLLVAALLIWMLLSALIASQAKMSSIFSTAEWFINGPLLMLYMFLFVSGEEAIYKLTKALFFTFLLVNCIGSIEAIVEKPILGNLTISETKHTQKAIRAKVRNESYRVKSVFTNPLVYAQFLLVSIVISMYLYKRRQYLSGFIPLCNVFLSYFLLYKTDSRAGLALAIFYPAIIFYIHLHRQRKKMSRALRFAIHFIALPLVVLVVGKFILDNVENAENIRNLLIANSISSEDVSTLARILQLTIGFEAFLQQPLFGYGMGQAKVNIAPLDVIDNYYLSTLLSIGIVGIALYFYFFLYVFKAATHTLRYYSDEATATYLASIIMLLVYYLILSISHGNILLFFFSGLIFIRRYQLINSLKTNTRDSKT